MQLRRIADDLAASHAATPAGVSDALEELRAIAIELQQREEHLDRIDRFNPQLQWIADAAGNVISISNRFQALTGVSGEQGLGMGWQAVMHPEDAARYQAIATKARECGESYDIYFRGRSPDGTYRWLRSRTYPSLDEQGKVQFVYGFAEDVHEQVVAQELLREREEHYRYSVELNPQIPWTAGPDGRILEVSAHGLEANGLAMADVVDEGWMALLHPDDRAQACELWATALATGEPFSFEYRLRQQNDAYRWFRTRAAARRDTDGRIIRWYGALEDIDARKSAEEQIRWAAHHDPLTGLPNRTLFNARLAEALAMARTRNSRVGLMLLDLDHLKRVNDALGHDAGDALLKTFAQRLRDAACHTATVARLGGDEFAVIIPELGGEEKSHAALNSILASLSQPFTYNGRVLDCGASIGAVAWPEQGSDTEELLRNADFALYSAKTAGRGTVKIFDNDMRAQIQRQSSMVNQAREAIREDRVVPFYQPKVELDTGAVAGFEALLRWHHPGRGLQPPQNIAAAFQDNELATALTDRVVAHTIEDMRCWLDQGLDFRRVAVNAAAADFRRGDLGERILEQLHAAGVPANRFELEVTEHVFLGRGAENVERTLRTLSAEGVTIALDDFGTGYASLVHLKQFPVDVIKIDQSFVHQLSDCEDNVAIVRAVVSLGRSLNITTVAEGIETEAQLDHLRREGCDLGQGYLFSRAVPAARVPFLLRELPSRGARPSGMRAVQ